MIRFAKEKDLERVNELRRQVNEVHVKGRPDMFKPGFCQEMQDAVSVFLHDENKDILVAERDGHICGMACVNYVSRPETAHGLARRYYHIEEFCVDETMRRQGVGTELFSFIAADAGRRGFERVELDMWEFNEGALKFYEAVGFRTYRRLLELKVQGEEKKD